MDLMAQETLMRTCIDLGEMGRKKVGNGAMVGAVLVRKNKIIAQGYHHAFGEKHAERELLEDFPKEMSDDDVLFVNLEPCCHTGKQPPCTDIILERGVKHVCFGMKDPDQRVSGKGIKKLLQAGVDMIGPVSRASAEYVNRGFISMRAKNRPWITLKCALTTDGRIAKDDHSPLRITSEDQDRWSHTYLRSKHDAILVGVETVVRDNPRLDTRLASSSIPRPLPPPEEGEYYKKKPLGPNIRNFSREMRKNPTPAEKMLWDAVRNDQLGVRIRRQYSLGGRIVDFYVPSHRLGIEIDGEYHSTPVKKIDDAEQDTYFRLELGIRILRLRNEQVLNHLDNALHIIQKGLSFPPPPMEEGIGVEENNKKSTLVYQPWRIILDPHLRIPLTSRVVSDEHACDTIIMTAEEGSESEKELLVRGVRVFHVPLESHVFEMGALIQKLITPAEGFFGITSILVEGGARTWEYFRNAGVVDEEVTLMGAM
jgi:pyrimidine deaminase RibD-like protein/riboflavin biosynthesis pyrimidine reductase/very-short-patch-repair endonuclease